jgi:hypothetical protein
MRQQPALHVEQETRPLPGKATESAGSRHDAMAGNDHRKGVRTARLADCPWRVVQGLGDFSISARLVRRNRRDLLPDAPLKRGSRGAQGQGQNEVSVDQIGRKLPRRFGGERIARSDRRPWRQEGNALNRAPRRSRRRG